MNYINTGDGVYREETAADRLAKAVEENRKERERTGKKEELNWKLLVGLKNPLV